MVRFLCCLVFLFVLAGCDQTPEQVYKPPVLTGKAYALAGGADHIAVVDLASTALTRIKMDKLGRDLAIASKALYVLAEDGSLASLKDATSLGPWQPGLVGGLGLVAPPDGSSLWILGPKELVQVLPAGQGKRLALSEEYSAAFFGDEPQQVWLVSRQRSTLTPLNLDSGALGKPLTNVGNSVHKGLAFPGAGELWIAEGNEYMNGEPYGVGYATKGPAMAGGINVIDLKSGVLSDFIMVGGNVVDLALTPQRDKVYAAHSQYPEYVEATLTVLDSKARRPTAELRLCQGCHLTENVSLKNGQGQVRALAISW